MKKNCTHIRSFSRTYAFLSNFYPCIVEYEGMTFPSVEHAFQAAKTLDMEERSNFCAYPDPATAKKAGRKLKLRKDWEDVKIDIMRQLVYDKFTRNMSRGNGYVIVDIRKKLLNTGNAYLEEGNNHGDRFWGTVKGEGQNWLGKILMEIRSELRGDDREKLKEKWNQLLDDLEKYQKMSLELFMPLFSDTWKYLTTHIKHASISCPDTALTNYLAVFSALSDYPGNVKQWEYDACGKFAEAVLRSISNIGESEENQHRFADGIIWVEEFMHDYTEVKLSEFESAFAGLCDRYENEVYYDGEM